MRASGFLKKAVLCIAGILTGYNLVSAMLHGAYLEANDYTFYVHNSVRSVLIVFAIAGLFFVFLHSDISWKIECFLDRGRNFEWCKGLLLAAVGVAGLYWIWRTGFQPAADQMRIQEAMKSLDSGVYAEYNFYFSGSGGYIGAYQNQLGYLLFSMLVSVFVGTKDTYLYLQYINVFCLLGIYSGICTLSRLILHADRRGQLLVLLFEISFFPLFFYSSYVYGILLGLMLAIFSLEEEIRFIRTSSRNHAFGAAFLIVLAVFIKNNELIFVAAEVVIALWYILEHLRNKEILRDGKWKTFLLYILVLCIGIVMQASLPKAYFEKRLAIDMGDGISLWSWVAMGIDPSYDRPGWYDGVVWDNWEAVVYDTEENAAVSKAWIQNSCRYFEEHPREAIAFFNEKLSSEWNNATFECFYILHDLEPSAENADAFAAVVNAKEFELGCMPFLNGMQIILYLGVLWYLIGSLKRRQIAAEELLFPVLFVGGFVFYFFWEAQPQYTIPFFYLLIPCAVQGYRTQSCLII